MKKICKITVVLLIILSLYSMIFNVYAGELDIWDKGKNFLDHGANSAHDGGFKTTEVNYAFENIVDFLWGLGVLVVFVSTVVLGIKYMLVNPNEKSRIKQATTPYIIGLVVIFGAVTIWKLIIEILEGSMGIGG